MIALVHAMLSVSFLQRGLPGPAFPSWPNIFRCSHYNTLISLMWIYLGSSRLLSCQILGRRGHCIPVRFLIDGFEIYLYFLIDKEFLHSLPIFLMQPSMVEPNTKRQSESQVFIKNFLEQIFHLGRGEGGGQREERRREGGERRRERERERRKEGREEEGKTQGMGEREQGGRKDRNRNKKGGR